MSIDNLFLNELNPINDGERLKHAVAPVNEKSTIYEIGAVANARLYCIVKSFVRGAVVGAGLGAIVSAATNNNVGEGVVYGLTAGAALDLLQAYVRASYYELKNDR